MYVFLDKELAKTQYLPEDSSYKENYLNKNIKDEIG
jgi:hypothetical protein